MACTPSEQGWAERHPPPPPPQPPAADCWIFDVDGCLVDSLTGSSLRPGALRLLEHLAAHRRTVLLWSAGGAAYARAVAEAFDLDGLVTGYHGKDRRDAVGSYETGRLPLGNGHAVFIDDHPEDLSDQLDVIGVSPYLSHDPHDLGLNEVLRRAGLD
jgi:long-chain acyl-CoA synthetase